MKASGGVLDRLSFVTCCWRGCREANCTFACAHTVNSSDCSVTSWYSKKPEIERLLFVIKSTKTRICDSGLFGPPKEHRIYAAASSGQHHASWQTCPTTCMGNSQSNAKFAVRQFVQYCTPGILIRKRGTAKMLQVSTTAEADNYTDKPFNKLSTKETRAVVLSFVHFIYWAKRNSTSLIHHARAVLWLGHHWIGHPKDTGQHVADGRKGLIWQTLKRPNFAWINIGEDCGFSINLTVKYR